MKQWYGLYVFLYSYWHDRYFAKYLSKILYHETPHISAYIDMNVNVFRTYPKLTISFASRHPICSSKHYGQESRKDIIISPSQGPIENYTLI